jgi:hypothetical protein
MTKKKQSPIAELISFLITLNLLFITSGVAATNLSTFKLTPELIFHTDHLYEINLKKNREFSDKIRGSFLGWDGQDLLDRSVTPPRRYPLAEIESVREYTGRMKGHQTGKGLGIGALTGVGLGLAGSIFALSADDCSTHEDPGECEGLAGAIAIITPVILTAVGAAVGAVVGTAIPKKERITYVP